MSGFDALGPIGIKQPDGVGNPYSVGRPYGSGKLLDDELGQEVEAGSEPFIAKLNDALMEVRGLQTHARDTARALASGEPVEVHDLMISMSKSEVAFNLMLEVRNKLLDAWQVLQRSVS